MKSFQDLPAFLKGFRPEYIQTGRSGNCRQEQEENPGKIREPLLYLLWINLYIK